MNQTDVFRPIYIVTQTEGMNNWLKQQIAEHLGIAANIQFVKPNQLIHKVYQIIGGQYTETLATHDLNWLLFKALDDESFKVRFKNIESYYSKDFINADNKRMALAEKIADLFDQYQVYRNRMIENWNQGQLFFNNDYNEKWQYELWQMVKKMADDYFPDKTAVGNYILEALAEEEKVIRLRQQLPVVFFFGLSLITEYHLHLIHEISNKIDVHFFLQNPAPEDYWFDDKSEKVINYLKEKGYYKNDEQSQANPLLVNWGKLTQDTFKLLFKDENVLNAYEVIGNLKSKEDTLLHHLQKTIAHNEKDGFEFTKSQLEDGSITISSCYSPVREVETLYNYLVYLIDQKGEELKARDIVVMVTDIDKYAAYIKAVFDNAPYPFFYTIADETYTDEDTAANALAAILSINENQMTSEKVVSLLNFSAIRKHFQIGDIQMIRQVVDDANIRFGIQGERANDSDYVSWRYGLKRMMYGLCMSGDIEYGSGAESFYPIDTVEGYDMQNVIKFVHFVELLIDSIKSRARKRLVAEWVEYTETVISHFLGENEIDDNDNFSILLNQFKRYNTLSEIFNEKVSYGVFSNHLLNFISTERKSHAFAGGGITFCSLIPMRSIPFKVVALLGMDFDKFPRKDRRVSFDLMVKNKKPGDRNLKENDKHLFLETILSAEQYLYISYVGKSVKDNKSIPPSIMIDELMSFIENHSKQGGSENLVTEHPLHNYSHQYNSGNKNLYSYLLRTRENRTIKNENFLRESISVEEILIKELIAFFKTPIKYYYNKILRVYYEEEELSLSETEVFTLDNLGKWKVKNDMMSLSADDLEAYRTKGIKLGLFPLKNMGEVTVETLFEASEFVRSKYQQYTQNKSETSVEIDLEIKGSRIYGKIENIFDNKLIHYSFSKNDNKHKFQAYLYALLFTVSNRQIPVLYISQNEEKVLQVAISPSSKEEAITRLNRLIEWYKKGLENILPFDFNMKANTIKDVSKLSLTGFSNGIGKNEYNDAYINKEYEAGTFNDEAVFELYLEIRKDLIELMNDSFEVL